MPADSGKSTKLEALANSQWMLVVARLSSAVAAVVFPMMVVAAFDLKAKIEQFTVIIAEVRGQISTDRAVDRGHLDLLHSQVTTLIENNGKFMDRLQSLEVRNATLEARIGANNGLRN